MTIQITTLATADNATAATSGVTLLGAAWSNTSTTDRTVTFRDHPSGTATTSVFTLDALGREHGEIEVGGGGRRFNKGLSASKNSGVKITVVYEDYS